MKLKSFPVLLLFLLPLSLSAQNQPIDYVDPFIGCAANGHTFPGACVPFGLVQTSPATGAVGWQYCSEYLHTDSLIWGFTQTHLNGTGCADLGDILIMPTSHPQTSGRQDQLSGARFAAAKADETASPGFYAVTLIPTDIRAELTATSHVAFHRYTFNQDSAFVYIDFQHGPCWSESQYSSQVRSCEINYEDDHTLTGHLNNAVWVEQDVYFVITFDHPFTHIQSLPLQARERGNHLLISFDLRKGEQLQAKIALSSATISGAQANLQAELPHWDFETTRAQAQSQWASYLNRIQIEGTDDQKTNFYTAFYHALIQPNNIADVDGTYRDANSQLANAGVGQPFYSTFSTWDTYRAAHPFYTIVTPEIVNPIVRSMLAQFDAQGHLPIWTLWGKENYCMIANHSVSIIAEAFHKGFRDYDAEKAFQAIKTTQTVSHKQKSDWQTYMDHGFLPTDLISSESVSITLESVYDDYAAADMAQLMGKTDEADYFRQRADFYKNLFDPTTRFMRPKLSDGTWKSPFNPAGITHAESNGGDYTEGNAWQYTFHVQHDVPGLIELFGGKKPFIEKLDSFFTTHLESTLSDVSGLIGQYAHGNEPSHHIAYLYALAGKPQRTQELIREIFDTQYKPTPDGLCGNDDCGQMSAWYMLSAMGFYPVDPVSAQYVFGAPQLPRISIQLPDQKTFTVVAQNLSEENKYVKKILLNGKPVKKPYISHSDVVAGGELRFIMAPNP